MKIFWSWQSDTPGRIGRHFVRDALSAAIKQLKETTEIEEPPRSRPARQCTLIKTAKEFRAALTLRG
jgi:hypothetical protein